MTHALPAGRATIARPNTAWDQKMLVEVSVARHRATQITATPLRNPDRSATQSAGLKVRVCTSHRTTAPTIAARTAAHCIGRRRSPSTGTAMIAAKTT